MVRLLLKTGGGLPGSLFTMQFNSYILFPCPSSAKEKIKHKALDRRTGDESTTLKSEGLKTTYILRETHPCDLHFKPQSFKGLLYSNNQPCAQQAGD